MKEEKFIYDLTTATEIKLLPFGRIIFQSCFM